MTELVLVIAGVDRIRLSSAWASRGGPVEATALCAALKHIRRPDEHVQRCWRMHREKRLSLSVRWEGRRPAPERDDWCQCIDDRALALAGSRRGSSRLVLWHWNQR